MKDIKKYAPWLLLITGLILLMPKFYKLLAELTNGTPYITIVLGAISVIVALLSFKK